MKHPFSAILVSFKTLATASLSGLFCTTKVVAPTLLHRLSELLGKRLTKKNCRILLGEYIAPLTHSKPQESLHSSPLSLVPDAASAFTPSFPSGPIAINSPFYVARPPIESQVSNEICKPGALVRVKAPREMGKTSLLLRVLTHAEQQGYHVVYLNLAQIDQSIFTDLKRFLRSLCASVTRQLQLESRLDDYWDEDIGSKVSCSLYIQQYLLEQLKTPLVLALDELNRVFEYPHVAKDVLSLLRSWYEEAKRVPIWQNLRLIIAHSTDVYVPLQLNQSPFNVGLATQLVGFTADQVQQLAQRYGLKSNEEFTRQLMAVVAGHPALIHQALYHLSCNEQSLNQLLAIAATPTGIYHHHLHRHWVALQQQPALLRAFQTLLSTNKPVYLEPNLAHQLNSMGLIHYWGNEVTISCELYRQHFRTRVVAQSEETAVRSSL